MNQFNYDAYMKNNPLLKETDGYGNYKIPVLEDKEDDNSEKITFAYNDHPSISNGFQRGSVKKFIKFVKSLGGTAEVIPGQDLFDIVGMKLSGVSSEQVKDALAQLEKEEDAKDFLEKGGPFASLLSWTIMDYREKDYNMKDNPLLKEYIPSRVYDDMTDADIADAEKDGRLNPSNEPMGPDKGTPTNDRSKVGPDEEDLEEIDSESESNFAEEFSKSLDSVRETTMYAHIAAKETGDQPWINALDRITSILDQLESYVDDRDRKLGVIRKREVNK